MGNLLDSVDLRGIRFTTDHDEDIPVTYFGQDVGYLDCCSGETTYSIKDMVALIETWRINNPDRWERAMEARKTWGT